MSAEILPKTYLTGYPCGRLNGRGALDGRPLQIEISDNHEETYPVRVISAGELLWSMTWEDARLLGDAFDKAAMEARP